MSGIKLFDSKGRLLPLDEIEPQLIDDAMRERFSAVVTAHQASAAADADVAACHDAIKDGLAAVADAENFLKSHYPPRTFLDEWRLMKATRANE